MWRHLTAENLLKDQKRVFLDFAVVWFGFVFKVERDTNRERARRKGEIEDARKRKERDGARTWRCWEERQSGARKQGLT